MRYGKLSSILLCVLLAMVPMMAGVQCNKATVTVVERWAIAAGRDVLADSIRRDPDFNPFSSETEALTPQQKKVMIILDGLALVGRWDADRQPDQQPWATNFQGGGQSGVIAYGDVTHFLSGDKWYPIRIATAQDRADILAGGVMVQNAAGTQGFVGPGGAAGGRFQPMLRP